MSGTVNGIGNVVAGNYYETYKYGNTTKTTGDLSGAGGCTTFNTPANELGTQIGYDRGTFSEIIMNYPSLTAFRSYGCVPPDHTYYISGIKSNSTTFECGGNDANVYYYSNNSIIKYVPSAYN
jgi:hypothetical protein